MGCHASKNNTNYRASIYKQEQAIHSSPKPPSPSKKLVARRTQNIYTGSRKFSSLSSTTKQRNSQNSTSDSQGDSGGKNKDLKDLSNLTDKMLPLSAGRITRHQKASTVPMKDLAPTKNIFNTSESEDEEDADEGDIQGTLDGEYVQDPKGFN